jgi:hypothetical protein
MKPWDTSAAIKWGACAAGERARGDRSAYGLGTVDRQGIDGRMQAVKFAHHLAVGVVVTAVTVGAYLLALWGMYQIVDPELADQWWQHIIVVWAMLTPIWFPALIAAIIWCNGQRRRWRQAA